MKAQRTVVAELPTFTVVMKPNPAVLTKKPIPKDMKKPVMLGKRFWAGWFIQVVRLIAS